MASYLFSTVARLRLYDAQGAYMYDIGDFIKIECSGVLNDVGEIVVDLPGSYDIRDFEPDGFFELWTTDINEQNNGVERLEFETPWQILEPSFSGDASGKESISIRAKDMKSVLDRRLVAYAEKTAQARKIQAADDMLKSIVSQNLSSGATDTARNMYPNLSVQTSTTQYPNLYWEGARKGVLGELKTIADQAYEAGYPLWFDVVSTGQGPTKVEFRTYSVRGFDRRKRVSNNPLTITPDTGAVSSYKLTWDYTSEVNYVYAGGDGSEDSQIVQPAQDSTRVNRGPFSRREAWVDARGTTDPSVITAKASAAVRAGYPRLILEGEIADVDGFRYGTDWTLGTWVDAQVKGYTFEALIRGVSLTFENGQRKVRASIRGEFTL